MATSNQLPGAPDLSHKQLIIFDWDGTLMDSVGLIVRVLLKVADAHNLALTSEAAKSIIGLSLHTAMQELFPEAGDKWNQLVTDYQEQYRAHLGDEQLFDGVIPMLLELKQSGYTLAVATGKSRAGLDRVLKLFALEELFAATRTADEAHSKPDPDMLEQILRELNFTAEKVVMIGDSSLDIHMANAAGIDALGVASGVLGFDELEKLDTVANAMRVTDFAKSFKS